MIEGGVQEKTVMLDPEMLAILTDSAFSQQHYLLAAGKSGNGRCPFLERIPGYIRKQWNSWNSLGSERSVRTGNIDDRLNAIDPLVEFKEPTVSDVYELHE
jgi:hypothetical protein